MELVGAVRVLIVDDFQPWRNFVASALQSDPQYLVVGFASDGLTAIKECERLRPDLIVLDIGLPGCDGINAAKEIRRIVPECDIVFLSQHTSAEYVQAAFEVGARGFVAKSDGRKLLSAVKTIMQGRVLNAGDSTSDESDPD